MTKCTPQCRGKAAKSHYGDHFRKTAGQPRVSGDGPDQRSGGEKTAAKAAPVVRDDGDQHRRDGPHLVAPELYESDVLRDKNHGHSNGNDGHAGQNETARARLNQEPPPFGP
jgi:hypothetical protein